MSDLLTEDEQLEDVMTRTVNIKKICENIAIMPLNQAIAQWAVYTDEYEQITKFVVSKVIVAYDTPEIFDFRKTEITNFLKGGLSKGDKVALEITNSFKGKKISQAIDSEKIKKYRQRAKNIDLKLERWRLKLRKACYGDDDALVLGQRYLINIINLMFYL